MEYSHEKLRSELERDEGRKNRLYRCTAGKLTIGIGWNIEDNGLPDEIVDALFAYSVGMVEGDLDRALPWWRDLSNARQRALLNMCFNLGLARLLKFENMLAALKEGRWLDAAAEAMASRWAVQVGDRAVRIAQMFKEG